ncbi:MAG: DUF4080 domain-containing protein [Phycisphaeraceae bacterium]|nr:DUF4080 domain-containing protein [Phycisphaeraceae bacterium]
MPDILLATLNARYAHSSFGLRYLLANLGALRDQAAMLELEITRRPVDVAEAILARNPRIVGLGVYIWNVSPLTEVVALLKRLRPELTVVLGGPEVSFAASDQEICRLADYTISGEADLAFAELCGKLLANQRPAEKFITAPLPNLDQLVLPYDLYDENDIAHRVVYVEASRGCPFSCEFCLSSLDVPLRQFPLPAFLAAMERLLARGVRQFKFVDRTFNLNLNTSLAILQFFHERYVPGLFLHFEMIPDRLPVALRDELAKFPPGSVQLEIGIQTFNPDAAARISRRQDHTVAEENLRFLRQNTGIYLHADLIVGLPGESLASFAAGFDRLLAAGPHEIQVGILKRLRGTPIGRHDAAWGMVYSPHPPYEILQNNLIDFPTMQRLRRFARYWDLLHNSQRFTRTLPLLWADRSPPSAFAAFLAFADWLFAKTNQTHAIALPRLTGLLQEYLVRQCGCAPARVMECLADDESHLAQHKRATLERTAQRPPRQARVRE